MVTWRSIWGNGRDLNIIDKTMLYTINNKRERESQMTKNGLVDKKDEILKG